MPRPYAEEPARRPLIILSTVASLATVTGTFIYSYPETLASVRQAMIWLHDIAGDLMVVAGAIYLWIHLKRTWRMRKLGLSWWTGIVTIAVFVVVAATGIYGQVEPMPSGSTLSTLHSVSTIALLALACFHGGYGLRRRL